MTYNEKINEFTNRLSKFRSRYRVVDDGYGYGWGDHVPLNIEEWTRKNLKKIDAGTYDFCKDDYNENNFSENNYSMVKKYTKDKLEERPPTVKSNIFHGSQCHGFALYILSMCSGEDVFIQTSGVSHTPDWIVFTDFQNNDFGRLKVGDFVRFNAHNTVLDDIHSGIVCEINNNEVKFLQTYYGSAYVKTDSCFNGGTIKHNGQDVDVKTEADILANADFIARYVPEGDISTTVEITFCANFGSNSTQKRDVEPGKSLSEYNSLFSRTGHTFEGWMTKPDGSSTIDKAPSSACTLYAKWKPIKYNLQFDWVRGGNTYKKTVQYDYGTEITPDMINNISVIPSSSNDIEFKYWAKYVDGEYVRVTGNIILTGNLTLYAMFRTYNNTIRFNGNGGTNLPSDPTEGKRNYEIGTDVSTRTGYKFIGWKTEKYDNLFFPGDELDLIKFEDDKDVVLTAQWEELYYKFTFDTFGISEVLPMEIPFSQIPLNQDDTKSFCFTDGMFPWLGFTSYGWKIKGDKSGNVYRSGDELPLKSYDFELADACPFPNSNGYIVTFDANGGENAPSPQLMQPGGTQILTSEEPTRAYHHFMGWATSPDSMTAEYAPKSRISLNESITLYAVWIGGGVRIKYETGVSDIDPYPECELPVFQLYNYPCLSEGMALSSKMPERMGYLFDGWSCAAPLYSVIDNALKMTCYPGETIQIPNINEDNYYNHVYDTITLTAKWKPDPSFEHEFPTKEDYWHKCKITFNANGGKKAPEPQYVNIGVCDILTKEEPTRDYHHFMGWTTDPDGYEVEYSPESLIATDCDMTLYAVWLGGCPRIKFESGVLRESATPAYDMPKSMLYTMGCILGEDKLKLPGRVPSRIGFIFDGWDCNESYTFNDDSSIYFDDIIPSDLHERMFDTITFTAKWKPLHEDQYFDVRFYGRYTYGNLLSHIKVRKGDKYCHDYSDGYHVKYKAFPTLPGFADGVNYFAWSAPDGGVLSEDSIVTTADDQYIYTISFEDDPFEDMGAHGWANKSVAICKYLGYISGTSPDTYSPGDPATRYQAAAILSRADGAAPTENNPFYDIKTDSDKNSVATWAWRNGISVGSNGAFKPDDKITRQELVAFLYNFAIYKGTISGNDVFDVDIEKIPNDFGEVSDWAINSMKWAVKNEIITVNKEKNIRPNDFVTRAELAVFILRTFVYTGVIPYCY